MNDRNQDGNVKAQRSSRVSLAQLLLIVANVACFLSFTRFAYVAATRKYDSIDFVLGVICLVLFPIGVGMLNRGSFATMVLSFAIAICSCLLVGYAARGSWLD